MSQKELLSNHLAGALIIAAAFWVHAPAAAAAPDTLTVTVRDADGVIPGAVVHVMTAGGRAEVRAITNGEGVATFAGLSEGTYDIRTGYPGFADAVRKGVKVERGSPSAVEFVLTVASLSTTVMVETANRREQLLLDVAVPTALIDDSQIRDSGARTAKDILVEQGGSGIYVNAGGGQGHLSINGIPNKGVLVLVNGRRYLGKDANGNLNLEELQLGGIDRIEVVKGAGSALYGSDALGGVVNFITRRPTERGVTNSFSASGGSYSDYRVHDTLSWRGARGGVSLGGGYRTYDGFDLDRKNPQTIGQPPSTYWNGSGNADLQVTPALTARFFGDYQLRKVRNYFFSGATQLASTVYDSRRDLTREMLSPEIEWTPASRTTVNAAYTYGRYLRDETRVFVADGRVVPQPAWREWNQELKLTGRHAFPLSGREHIFQGGLEYRNEKLRRGTLNVTDPHRDIRVFWGQQEFNLTGRLRVTAGVRWDDYSDFGSEWSPKADAVFTVATGHRLRASYGHGFRPPYFGELYLNQPPFFVGNPELLPESSDGFTGGYAWSGKRAHLSLDGYHTRVRNGITFFQLTPSRFTYRNIDRYNSKGANLQGSVSLPGGFAPSVAYTYNRRVTPAGAEVGGYPNHSGYVKLLWANPRLGLRANLRAQLNGKVPPGTDGTYQPSYNVWSAQASRRFGNLGAFAVNVFVQVDNLFNRRDIFLANPDGSPVQGQFQVWLPPRTFQVGLSFDADWAR